VVLALQAIPAERAVQVGLVLLAIQGHIHPTPMLSERQVDEVVQAIPATPARRVILAVLETQGIQAAREIQAARLAQTQALVVLGALAGKGQE
jgi:hypothetical protein